MLIKIGLILMNNSIKTSLFDEELQILKTKLKSIVILNFAHVLPYEDTHISNKSEN